ncbi:MAG: amidohydrolase [Promethearchaeota archaeon]
MILLRGYADDLPLHEWLNEWIFPLEAKLNENDVYVGAKLAAVESALSGVACLDTMYHYMDKEAKAISEVGIRGVVGHVCFSFRKEDDRIATRELVRNWHNKAGGLIRVSIDPHAVYTVDPGYFQELKLLKDELSKKHGTPSTPVIWHVHTAETPDEMQKAKEAVKTWNQMGIDAKDADFDQGVFEYLNSLGVLGSDVVAAHCVSLTPRDIQIMSENDIKVAHNPVSNLKLASGISPLPELLDANITVGLGTDSACSNNTLDMFETLKMAALLHKGVSSNPTVIPAKTALRMATIEGAKTLLWDNEIGSLEIGKKADIILVNINKPHLTPLYDEFSHLAYAVRGSDVETTIVNGKVIVENRKLQTVDVDKLMEEVVRVRDDILSRLET